MRIFQFVFAIWAFFSTSDFKTTLTMDCDEKIYKKSYEIEYPFEFAEIICRRKPVGEMNTTLLLSVDVSSDAQFFVITAVLAMLYAMFIIFVYLYLDDMYKTKPEFPMAVSFYKMSINNHNLINTNFLFLLLLLFRILL